MPAPDPLLSAIIPTRDRPDKLAALLRRLAAQTIPPERIQVLIADDGSREPVLPAVQALGLPLPVEVVRGAGDGPAAARNLVLPLARAPLLLFLNDDVLPAADLCERHLEAHERLGPRHSVFGTFWFTDEVRRDRFSRLLEDAGIYGNRCWAGERTVRYWCVWTPNLSLPRAALDEVGAFDPRYREAMVEDIDLGLRLERAGYRCFYTKRAVALHDHVIDFPGWMRRNERIGHNRWLMFEKYREPELLSDRDPQSWPDPGFAAAGADRLRRDRAPMDDLRALAGRLAGAPAGALEGESAEVPLLGKTFRFEAQREDALEMILMALYRYDYSLGLLSAAAAAGEEAPGADLAASPSADAPEGGAPAAVEVATLPTAPADFVRAFDAALRRARADVCLLHDPRARLTSRHISLLLRHMEQNPKAAIVAPLLGYLPPDPDADLAPGDRARRLALLRGIGAAQAGRCAGRSRPVPEVLPPVLLVRRAPLIQAGGLHAHYRLAPYAMRDLDLKLRALGLEVRVALDVLVPIDVHRDRLIERHDRAAADHDLDLFLSRWGGRRPGPSA